jgi:hypothetical protein
MIWTPEQAQAAANAKGWENMVVIFGFRSANSQYGKYDDIAGILTPNSYDEVEFNTMPSVDNVGVAVLQPGDYDYVQGLHGISHLVLPADQPILDWLNANPGQDHAPVYDSNGNARLIPYWAYRQAGPVMIKRIGHTVATPDGWPDNPAWIDLHKGGYNLTSSLGCQTFFPAIWPQARQIGYSAMDALGTKKCKYSLIQQ